MARVGDLKHRVRLERQEAQTGDIWSVPTARSAPRDTWALVEPVSPLAYGRMSIQTEDEITHKVTLRDHYDLAKNDRIVWDGRHLQVRGVQPNLERRQIVAFCTEYGNEAIYDQGGGTP